MTDFAPLDTFRDNVGQRPDPARRARVREEFRARIATMATDHAGRRPFDPRVPTKIPSRRQRHARPLAVVGLVLVLALGAGLAFGLDHRPSGNSSAEQLAQAAASRPDTTLDVGQYLYVSERVQAGDGTTRRDQWTAANGTGQSSEVPLSIAPLPNGGVGTPPPVVTLHPLPGSLAFAGMSYDQLRSLPADPAALLERLGPDETATPGGRAGAVAQVLALDVTPPDVAAGAIRALVLLGGREVGPVRDATGRIGVGFQGDNGDGTTWLVVLDPSSGRTRASAARVEPGRPLAEAPGHLWLAQDITGALPTR